MPNSITGWTRLEPYPHDETMSDALQARLGDPLWLLARQWQLGEFQGEDAGSPTRVDFCAQTSILSRYAPRVGTKYDHPQPLPQGVALETLVESEPLLVQEEVSVSYVDIEAGLHFLRLLRRTQSERAVDVITALLTEFAVRCEPACLSKLDLASQRYFGVLQGRALDGGALHRDIHSSTRRSITEEVVSDFADVVKSWLALYKELYAPPRTGSAWQNERINYRFGVSAWNGTGELGLSAEDYIGGRLDWYAFDYDPNLKMGVGEGTAPRIERSFIPTPLRFKGMPSPRYWEFEEGEINLSRIEAGPEDLARLLLVEFMLIFGNDFFVFPVEMRAGSLCDITKFVVTDTFGKPVSVLRSASKDWSVFTQTNVSSTTGTDPAGFFFLAPALIQNLESPPFEEVAILRDEMANMAWAVQRLTTSPAGLPVDHGERHRQKPLAGPKSIQDPPIYRLEAAPPPHWFPLVPTIEHGQVFLKEGELWRPRGFQPREATEPGVLLDQVKKHPIPLCELPREGLRLTRSFQYTRSSEGNVNLWVGRRKAVGRGEGSSGLRYDFLEDGRQE